MGSYGFHNYVGAWVATDIAGMFMLGIGAQGIAAYTFNVNILKLLVVAMMLLLVVVVVRRCAYDGYYTLHCQ